MHARTLYFLIYNYDNRFSFIYHNSILIQHKIYILFNILNLYNNYKDITNEGLIVIYCNEYIL